MSRVTEENLSSVGELSFFRSSVLAICFSFEKIGRLYLLLGICVGVSATSSKVKDGFKGILGFLS